LLGRTTGDIGAWYANDAYTYTGVWDHLGLPTPQLSNNSAMAKCLALTNPSRPHIDVPNFIGELKDMPKMLKEVGRLQSWISKASKDGRKLGRIRDLIQADFPLLASKGFISWNFGWAPLFSDLSKMLGFTAAADKRFAEIRSFAKGTSLHRRQDVWTERAYSGPHDVYTPVAYGANLRHLFLVETEGKQWATCKWYPQDHESLPQDSTQQRKLAEKLVRGTAQIGLSTAWNLMPWSWLIDWFSNTGDRIAATRNTLNLIPINQCVMVQHVTRIKSYSKVDTPQTGHFTLNPEWGRVTKTRYRVDEPLTFEARVPFLSLKQMSILSGLAIQNLGH